MKKLNEILWFFAGSDRTVLNRCPSAEKTKHTGIGATIFVTATLAILSGTYAAKMLTDSYSAALGIGLFWGFVIFNIDRLMVGSMKKDEDNNKWKEVLHASPRFFLAIVIALVISKPVEVKILENQIEKQLAYDQASERNDLAELNIEASKIGLTKETLSKSEGKLEKLEEAAGKIADEDGYKAIEARYENCKKDAALYETKIQNKNREINQAKRDNSNLKKVTIYIIDGVEYTNPPLGVTISEVKETKILNAKGNRIIKDLNYQIRLLRNEMPKCNKILQEQQEYINTRKIEIANEKSGLRKKIARVDSQMIAKTEELNDLDDKNKVIIEKAGGDLFGKLIALENAKRNTETQSDTLNGAVFTVTQHEKLMMRNISWAIMAFFFILEICPILVKIITDRGIYEDLINAQAIDIKEDLKLQNERKRNQIKHQIDLDKEQINNSFDVDIETEDEIRREIAEARKEIAREVVEKWKDREKERLNENADAYLDEVVR